jgi:uracil-DNA glycosylase
MENLMNLKLENCTFCNLSTTRTQVVKGRGSHHPLIMFLGECPGKEEDLSGKPFVGKAGQLLSRIIKVLGLTEDEVYISNCVKCRAFEGNRNCKPTESEMASCRVWLEAEISMLKPKLIVLLGATALESQLGMKGITTKRGVFYTSPDNTKTYFVMYHPAACMYDEDKQEDMKSDVLRLSAYIKRLKGVD